MVTRPDRARAGAFAPLTGFLLVFIMAMIAFAIDLSWIVSTKNELQNVADSSALAGAHYLMDGYVQYYLGSNSATKASLKASSLATARNAAKKYFGYHSAGAKSLSILDSDIEFGFMAADGTYTVDSKSSTEYPNTIKVLARRDSVSNGSLNLFFAPVLGKNSADLQATATASIYNGEVVSFSGGLGLLPVVYDRKFWDTWIETGVDADGNKTSNLLVYPSIKFPGNFGYINFDVTAPTGNANAIKDWINQGLTNAEVNGLLSKNLLPLFKQEDVWDWSGSTGFKSSDVMAINDHVGQVFTMPLFKAKNYGGTTTTTTSNGNGKGKVSNLVINAYEAGVGTGANFNFEIVDFVGVKIMPYNKYNGDVTILPAAVSSPNFIFDKMKLASGGSNFSTTFATPRLSK